MMEFAAVSCNCIKTGHLCFETGHHKKQAILKAIDYQEYKVRHRSCWFWWNSIDLLLPDFFKTPNIS